MSNTLSARTEALPSIVKTEMELEINQTDSVTMRAGKVFISLAVGDSFLNSWRTHAAKLRSVARLIENCEVREIKTILELALWKAKIEEGSDQSGRRREEYRVKCGAETVVKGVLHFLSYDLGLFWTTRYLFLRVNFDIDCEIRKA